MPSYQTSVSTVRGPMKTRNLSAIISYIQEVSMLLNSALVESWQWVILFEGEEKWTWNWGRQKNPPTNHHYNQPPTTTAPTIPTRTPCYLRATSTFMILSICFLNFLTCGITAKVHGICLKIQRNVQLMMPARAPKSETTFSFGSGDLISRFSGFPLGDQSQGN